jgi:hypothetical protein
MARYLPPTRVVTLEMPLIALVTRCDPNWARNKHWEIEYKMRNGRRLFFANPYIRGPYNPVFDNPPTPSRMMGIELTDSGDAVWTDAGTEIITDENNYNYQNARTRPPTFVAPPIPPLGVRITEDTMTRITEGDSQWRIVES